MSEPETPYKIQSESPMKRYFLVSYAYGSGFGSIGFHTEGIFPKKKDIFDSVEEKLGCKCHCIISIFEFKSEKDYNEFIAE